MGKIQGAPIIASVKAIKMNSGGSCSLGESANTPIGTISASGVCAQTHWLDPLYYVFFAIHALAAVRVFLSA